MINPHSSHSRAKRDLGDILDSRNPDDLFHYLYPSASSSEHGNANKRSMNYSDGFFPTNSFTRVLYGLKEFWMEECYFRHKSKLKLHEADIRGEET